MAYSLHRKNTLTREGSPGIGSVHYLFEDCAFDTNRRELHRAGKVVAISPQVFDLLDYLIRNRERVVSKGDLINAIWSGRIVSDAALPTRLNIARNAIGDSGEEQRLIKTLPRKGFRFVGQVREVQGAASAAVADNLAEPQKAALALPDKPSIAVLPFQNMSGDPEQEYFADGMVEDIITALSRFKSLFVIARDSSFSYKGKIVDIKQVGRELGVRYVLEGSVRKAGGRLRITGQLIEAVTGAHLWADRFDGSLEDVFDLQDKMTEKVIGALAPRVHLAEIERSRRKPVENLDAYDCFLRGTAGINSFDRIATEEALKLFYRAIELDPSFPTPYSFAARTYLNKKIQGWTDNAGRDEAETMRLALRVAAIGQDDEVAMSWAGLALAVVCREYEMGAAFADQALLLNQNLAAVVVNRGNIYSFVGEQEKAIEHFTHGLRLSPLDSEIYRLEMALAIALMLRGRFLEAVDWSTRSLARQPNWNRSWRASAAAHALAGNLDEARRAMGRLRELDPTLRLSRLPQTLVYRCPKDLAMWTEGLRLAGLPE
jgi:TolB-like protein/Flp pilus assembly protein TadD